MAQKVGECQRSVLGARSFPLMPLLLLTESPDDRCEHVGSVDAALAGLESPVVLAGDESGGAALLDLSRVGSERLLWHATAIPIEIERKYLLRALPPEAAAARSVEVRQGYLPGERLVERLRHERDAAGDRYYRTVKVGRGLARLELEEACEAQTFEIMWALTAGRRLTKRRHFVQDGALTWEVDEFTDRALVLAEVELDCESRAVPIPAWLAPLVVRDVTDEEEYVNARLAL